VQLVVIPLSDAELPYAEKLVQRCLALDLRAEISLPEQGSLGARIREARLVPYQAIIGAKEVANDQASLRLRSGERLEPLPVQEALALVKEVVDRRRP
jgi:threonyl-tRNA synthetase